MGKENRRKTEIHSKKQTTVNFFPVIFTMIEKIYIDIPKRTKLKNSKNFGLTD
jgi:hypothetical protein